MNPEQAKRDFVETNHVLLTAASFDRQAYKRAHRAFFVDRLNNKCGLPGIKEIATVLIIYLKQRGISVAKIKQYVDEIPFFLQLDAKQRKQLVAQELSEAVESVLDPQDLALIRGGRAFEAVERIKGKEITHQQEQKLQQLEDRLKLKQDEYESLPSVLDERTIDEPEFNAELEERKSWWERFYLTSNPFPRKDGLQAIDRDLYENVVVKTEPFIRLQNEVRQNPNCLFNTGRLLAGDFGFGKTTLLDYFEYYLVQFDILSLRISAAKAYSSASAYLDSFFLKLTNILQGEVEKIFNRPQGDLSKEQEDKVAFLSGLVCERKKGILVILDDYHKHPTPSIVFEFLGMLQIIKDQLGRQEINVGFLVSGLPEWVGEIRSNAQLSGFLDSPPIVMPEITPKAVVDVFNHRIAAFCFDSQARTIRQEFVERIFKKIGSASYRDYLNTIVTELEDNNLAIVNSPVDISETELSQIKAVIESDDGNSASLRKLIHESRFQRFTAQQIRKCVEVLVQITLRDGVAEGDRVFQENAFYFQRLKDVGLLQKRKGGPNNAKFCWTIHNRLRRKLDEITERFRRSASDYLLKIYGGQTAEVPLPSTASKLSRLAAIDKQALPKAVSVKLAEAQGIFESTQQPNPSLEQRRQAVSRIRLAISHLLEAIFELDETGRWLKKARIVELCDQASIHWSANSEEVLEAVRRLDTLKPNSERTEVERALRQATIAFEYLEIVVSELCKDISDSSRPFAFRHRSFYHNDDVLKVFTDAQENFFSAKATTHFEYVRQIVDAIELHVRKFLYASTVLAFGMERYFESIPDSQRKDAYKNAKNRESHSSVYNHFDGLTRSQYRSIFTDRSKARELVTDSIVLGWDGNDRRLFFDLLAEESIATSHNQERAYSVAERSRYMKLGSLSDQFLGALNVQIKKAVCELSVVEMAAFSTSTPIDECVFKFGMSLKRGEAFPANHVVGAGETPLLNMNELYSHSTTTTAFDRVMKSIEVALGNKPYLVENLLDIDYLASHYQVAFPDLMCCLVYGAFVAKRFDLYPWRGSSVVICKSLSR